jgi:DNA replication protein DnaC
MRFLTDQELTRLKASHPEIAEGICPTCRDVGHYVWKNREYECDCGEQKRLNKLYTHAGIGLDYQRLDWEDLHIPDEYLGPIHKYIDTPDKYINRGMGFFISGTLGAGKTLISNLLLKALIKKDYDCYFTTFSNTIESFTATWGSQENKTLFADRFMRSRVLCLDDLGKEHRINTKLPTSTFDHILRTRTQNARPTILTSNLGPNEVRTGYGAGVLSLLLQQSIAMHLEGIDFRARAHDRTMGEIDNDEIRPIC